MIGRIFGQFNSPDDDKLSYKLVCVLRFSSAAAEIGIVDIR